MQKKLKVALVGAGMAGQAHAFGYRNASMADDLAGLDVELAVVMDASQQLAQDVRRRYGFAEATTELSRVLDDPEIDAVSVALPNVAHREVLDPIIRSGKHVLTEKPLGLHYAEAKSLAELAAQHDAVHAVGFSYRRIPGLAELARIVREGRLGEIHHFESSYYADHAASPDYPFSWRFEQETSGGGALIDLGAHAIDSINFAISPIAEVLAGDLRTRIETRKDRDGNDRAVTNDDVASAILRTESGATGTMITSRIAFGHPNRLSLSVFGSRGYAHFDTEHYNEVRVFEAELSDEATSGPRTVVIGPANPHYSDVSSFRSRGVNTGYGEAFIAEVQDFLRAVAGGHGIDTSFDSALATMRVVSEIYGGADRG